MDFAKLIEDFRAWLAAHELEDVEIEQNVGPDEGMTTITFPVDGEDGDPSFDIVASLAEDTTVFFCGEYCDIPEVDELELLRFVNELNTLSPLTLTVEDDSLCFAYSLPIEYVADAEKLAHAFIFVWDSMDELRDDIRDAFGLSSDDEEEAEEEIEEEEAAEEEAATEETAE